MIDVVLALMIIGSFLISIPLHEWSHAQVAAWLGDFSPRVDGRQTARLRPHIDPIGTLMCVILAFQSAFGLGWGRPVKPDPWKMKVGANTGVLLVACAGPIFSLLLGLLTAGLVGFLYTILLESLNYLLLFLFKFLTVFAVINVGLAIFNLIPLYPLDGYQILYTLLPSKQAVQFSRSATYGPLIILAIFFLLPFILQLVGIGFQPASIIGSIALALVKLVSNAPVDAFYTYGLGVFSGR